MASEDKESAIFHKYWERIAQDLGLACVTEGDKEQVWERLATLPTFVNKGALPKLGRWFSWNSVAHEQLQELSALRMLLEHHLEIGEEEEEDMGFVAPAAHDDPRAELQALKATAGGFKLAYKLMSDDLCHNARVLYAVTNGLWDWYTEQVQQVKTPKQGLKYEIGMVHKWARHARSTIVSLSDTSKLQLMGFIGGFATDAAIHDERANNAMMLVWHLVSNRTWSLARYSCPPYSCSRVAAAAAEAATEAAGCMHREWSNLLRLEEMALSVPAAQAVRQDIHWACAPCVRLLYLFFERDEWAVASKCGQRWLRGLLMKLPDNKIVEDVHSKIRNNSRANANTKLTTLHIQELINGKAWKDETFAMPTQSPGIFSGRRCVRPKLAR
jgi:hypothetical protein